MFRNRPILAVATVALGAAMAWGMSQFEETVLQTPSGTGLAQAADPTEELQKTGPLRFPKRAASEARPLNLDIGQASTLAEPHNAADEIRLVQAVNSSPAASETNGFRIIEAPTNRHSRPSLRLAQAAIPAAVTTAAAATGQPDGPPIHVLDPQSKYALKRTIGIEVTNADNKTVSATVTYTTGAPQSQEFPLNPIDTQYTGRITLRPGTNTIVASWKEAGTAKTATLPITVVDAAVQLFTESNSQAAPATVDASKFGAGDFTVKFTGAGIGNIEVGDGLQIVATSVETEIVNTVTKTAKESVVATEGWQKVNLKDIENAGQQQLSVHWLPKDPTKIVRVTNTVDIDIDTKGPVLDNVNLTGMPETGQRLVLTFADGDLNPGTVILANLAITDLSATPPAALSPAPDVVYAAGSDTVEIFVSRLQVGTYKLEVKPDLKDVAGNPATPHESLFSSEPAPEQGPRIEFPPFLPTVKDPSARRPNPGDRVQTRVARLYYFRDAERVAQLVNRMTKSYNRAAVTQAERRAEGARVKANKLTDQRRAKERAAVQAAVETRREERKLQQAYEEIQRLSQLQTTTQQQTTSTGTIFGGTTTDGSLTAASVDNPELSSGTITNIRSLAGPGDMVTGTIIATAELGAFENATDSDGDNGDISARLRPNTVTISSASVEFELPRGVENVNQSTIIDARTLSTMRLTSASISITSAEGTTNLTDVTIENARLTTGQIRNIIPQAGTPAEGNLANGILTRGLISDGSFTGQVDNANIDGTTKMGAKTQILSGDVRVAEITKGKVDGTIRFKLPDHTTNPPSIPTKLDIAAGSPLVEQITAATIDSDVDITLKRVANAAYVTTPPGTQNVAEAIQQQRDKIRTLESNIAAARSNEIQLNEQWKVAEADEDRAIEDQFLADVAAAHEDPDTYAPATKNSVDPVAQVSISVIGAGLLHLRGPIHGINEVRKMINQIDSPVGQVKVGIHTIQINGEKGDRMEKVASRIEGHLDLGRFLTNQCLRMLRRAVQIEAAIVAQQQGDLVGHYQVDRDQRYLYDFFGRDFIDELYEMDSEFLRSENKLLSLHSMDTISLNRALFIMALAKNDVRERIVQRFMQMVYEKLPEAEWDFRRSSELHPHKTRRHLPFTDKVHKEARTLNRVYRNARQRYHFRNLRSFFEMDSTGEFCLPGDGAIVVDGLSSMGPDTMNSMQRTFLRLAQIFKSQMIAEEEVKQRVIERAIIEDEREESFKQEQRVIQSLRQTALDATLAAQKNLIRSQRDVLSAVTTMETAFFKAQSEIEDAKSSMDMLMRELEQIVASGVVVTAFDTTMEKLRSKFEGLQAVVKAASKESKDQKYRVIEALEETPDSDSVTSAYSRTFHFADLLFEDWEHLYKLFKTFANAAQGRPMDWAAVVKTYHNYAKFAELVLTDSQGELKNATVTAWQSVGDLQRQNLSVKLAEHDVARTRAPLDHKKLLDFLIDEREEKQIELLEGTRAYIASVDQYLKRLSTALEDDFKVQFYDPAFIHIRAAAREYDVQLGQVERTTILMNNRAIAIVKPSATMEFDLPKRDIVIVEALNGAKALAEDYGALLTDPTFLAAYQMMGGGLLANKVINPIPTLNTQTNEQNLGLTGIEQRQPGSSLQSLVPDPAVYKFETGTGFEIRPVIQPDGDSIVYDFHYMYTTNIREPVRADEKHLGRIKRHFIDTQVQTSSFELREVSRYLVALKASRTSRGVPLFEDIPGIGLLFRPAPSDESSLQQNIILAKSTVYPTLFDLMGLRWARHVVDLDHVGLRDSEHIVRGRNTSIEDFVFDKASDDVDQFLDIPRKYPKHYRPDLYHRQRQPSPYHPGGYIYEPEQPNDPTQQDPTGRSFRIRDRRPAEFQSEPPYDDRFRRPYEFEQLEMNSPSIRSSKLPTDKRDRSVEFSVTPASHERADAPSRNRQRTRQVPPLPRVPPLHERAADRIQR